jgi:O-antigen/teichoic acid export membrane protein
MGAVYKARGQAGIYALLTLYLQSFTRLVMVVFAALFSPTIFAVVCINTVQLVFSGLAIFLHDMRRSQSRVGTLSRDLEQRADADWAEVYTVLRESSWMALSVFVYGMMRFVDVLMLGSFASAKEVGEYSALSTISQLVQVYPFAASQSLGPAVSRHYHSGDLLSVRKALGEYLYIASIASGFIFAGIAVFGDRLDLVFGQSFQFHPAVCFIMPLGYVLSATLAPMGYSLSMTGRHRAELVILCIGGGMLLALCRLLIPDFGQLGAAIAVASSFFTINVIRYAYVAKVLGFLPGQMQDFLPPVAALCFALAARYLGDLLGERSFMTTLLSCILYACAFGIFCFSVLLHSRTRTALIGTVFRKSRGGL